MVDCDCHTNVSDLHSQNYDEYWYRVIRESEDNECRHRQKTRKNCANRSPLSARRQRGKALKRQRDKMGIPDESKPPSAEELGELFARPSCIMPAGAVHVSFLPSFRLLALISQSILAHAQRNVSRAN